MLDGAAKKAQKREDEHFNEMVIIMLGKQKGSLGNGESPSQNLHARISKAESAGQNLRARISKAESLLTRQAQK